MKIRIGHGVDVHAFYDAKQEQQFITLAGVKIEHTHSLKAHSDGDVVLHSLADALLGSLALGDIGRHFPDSDIANKGLDSRILLRQVYDLVRNQGYHLVNADITIICEYPKIAPHQLSMRQNIADDLQIDVNAISIKATTSEKLGFTGRKEGVLSEAVVLLAAD